MRRLILLGVLLVKLAIVNAAGCPTHCRCYVDIDGYKSANCSAPVFSRSTQPDPTIESLNILHVHRAYSMKLFPLYKLFKNLVYLNMSNCSISFLPNESFYGLNYIQEIDISFNRIRHLSSALFAHLDNLRTLVLRGNPLHLSPMNTIISKNLHELDLGYCNLTILEEDVFSRVPSLLHLSLDGNQLTTLTYHVLPKSLKYLNLANNKIVNVPTDVLTSMSYLQRLDLSGNPINCTCRLLIMQDLLSGKAITLGNDVICAYPPEFAGMKINRIVEDDLCKNELIKERRINHINYSRYLPRRKKSYHKVLSFHEADFQADQPVDAEELFSNPETIALGTHLEHKNQEEFLPVSTGDASGKLPESLESTEFKEKDTEGKSFTDEGEMESKLNEESELEGVTHDNNQDEQFDDIEASGHASEFESTYHSSSMKESQSVPIIDEDSKESTNTEKEPLEEPSSTNEDASIFDENDNTESVTSHSISVDNKESTADRSEGTNSATTEHIETNEENMSMASETPSSEPPELKHSGEETESDFENYSETTYETGSEGEETSLHNGISTSPESSTDHFSNSEHSFDYSINNESSTTYETEYYSDTTSEGDLNYSINGNLKEEETESTTLSKYEESSPETSESNGEDTFVESSTSSFDDMTTTISPTDDIKQHFVSADFEVTSETPVATEHSSPGSATETEESSTTDEELSTTSKEWTVSTSQSWVSVTSEEPSSTTEASPVSGILPAVEEEFWVEREDDETKGTVKKQMNEDEKWTDGGRETEEMEEETLQETVDDVTGTSVTNSSKEEYKSPPGTVGLEEEEEEGRNTIGEDAARSPTTQESMGSYIVIVAIGVLVLALIVLAVCKRRRRSGGKIRLPVDPESNNQGTEMRDMDSLLPKSPENGVKIVPKNYGEPNGSVSKEEIVPVLSQPDGFNQNEESPEKGGVCEEERGDPEGGTDLINGSVQRGINNPNETAPSGSLHPQATNGSVQKATARLTLLPESIPKTPVFIHKPYTD